MCLTRLLYVMGVNMATLEALVTEFLTDTKARALSPGTTRWYGQTLRPFLVFALGQSVTELTGFDARLVRLYMGECVTKLSPGGAHARMRALRALSSYLVSEELLEVNPFNRVKLPKVPDRALDVVSEDQFRSLMSAAGVGLNPLRDQTIFSVMFDTGLRAMELCGVRLDDVQSGEGGIMVQRGKGDKHRFVPASRWVLKTITRYVTLERPKTAHENLFMARGDAPLCYESLRGVIERHCITAGLKTVRPHAFRRGFAVAYIRNGGDAFTLQRILGHTTLAMSSKYARMNVDDVKDVHSRVSPVGRSAK